MSPARPRTARAGRLGAFALGALVVAACAGDAPLPATPAGLDTQSIAQASNRLAFDVWRGLGDGNVAFAPAGLSTGLALIGLAAQGSTRAAFVEAFHGVAPELMAGLPRLLMHIGPLRLATAVAVGDATPSPELVSRIVGAGAWVQRGDAGLDAWARVATGNAVSALPPSPPGNALTLYHVADLASRWLEPLDGDVSPEQFYVGGAAPVEVAAMHRVLDQAGYVDTPAFEAVLLADEDHGLQTVLLVPHERNGLGRVEALLGDELLGLLDSPDHPELGLTLPRVQLAGRELDLAKVLAAGPLAPAFAPDADFGPIDPDAYLGGVRQWTSLSLDEGGTRATSVTEHDMWKAEEPRHGDDLTPRPAPPKVVVDIDRPFLVLVRTAWTKIIVFMARVTDPTRP
ncbi:MAG: serpin family protein [Myxococcota bacterium]